MNDMSLLAIALIIYVIFVICVIHTCYYYGIFSYVVKLGNLTPFILKLMTERMC